jgi:hypothetical protein
MSAATEWHAMTTTQPIAHTKLKDDFMIAAIIVLFEFD